MDITNETKTGAPNPFAGWATQTRTLQGAVVVPAAIRSFHQPSGILDADGNYCAAGALWRKDAEITTRPEPPADPPEKLAGRWLWGGVLWRHFGHFVVESTGRLWGLPQEPGAVEGVLFMPKSPRNGSDLVRFQTEFFALAGCSPRVLTAPTQVEELIVPGQGFGIGRIVLGTDACRNFFHNRFAQEVAPDGPERLYLSRSAIGPTKGALICERRLEKHLAAEGYEIFHPQRHDIRTQIARYKAARQVIAAEGSAVHMFGLVAGPEQKLAVIVRRQSAATGYIVRHIRAFSRIEPLMINEIQRTWRHTQRKKPRFARGEPDMPAIQSALAGEGFVSDDTPWPALSEKEIRADLTSRKHPTLEYEVVGKPGKAG